MALTYSKSLRLPPNQFFPQRTTKVGIAIHHTVGASAKSTFEYWLSTVEMVGTAYIIDRDGTVFEVFDPDAWAWQFGLDWPADDKVTFEKRFVGIEIASEGGLVEKNGSLFCFDRISDRTMKKRDEAFDFGKTYRSYRFFDKYDERQVNSVVRLVDELCSRYGIERAIPADHLGYYGKRLAGFKGIIGHASVRLDKSDPSPQPDFWQRLIQECHLEEVSIDEGVNSLFEANIAQLSSMQPAAGCLVKGLLYELQRDSRNTYIKLYDAVPGGYGVSYALVSGEPGLVKSLAGALGFKSATDSRLEVCDV